MKQATQQGQVDMNIPSSVAIEEMKVKNEPPL